MVQTHTRKFQHFYFCKTQKEDTNTLVAREEKVLLGSKLGKLLGTYCSWALISCVSSYDLLSTTMPQNHRITQSQN